MMILDATFSALADPTRRAILVRLAQGEATVGELAEPFAMSLPAISRHLKVLAEAALITNERHGKHRHCRLRPEALSAAADWLDFHRRFWSGSFERLADHLSQPPHEKKPMSSTAESTTLEITRLFDAPPARVFDAWLKREEWQAWIGPKGIECEVPLLEPRVGGHYRIIMHLSDGRVIPVAGVFTVIDAPRTLGFTWGWEGDASRDSLITLSFRARGEGTELTLRQEGLGSVASRDDHGQGWNSALDKLADYLTTKGMHR